MISVCSQCASNYSIARASATICGYVEPDTPAYDYVQQTKENMLRMLKGAESWQRPPLDLGSLWGSDGNAFVILGRIDRALKDLGSPLELRKQIGATLRLGSYVDLLRRANVLFELQH